MANLKKKKVYVATNFLESMVKNKYPTLAEANDIYNTLKDGASGLVLAAETAVGKYPKECVVFLKNMIKFHLLCPHRGHSARLIYNTYNYHLRIFLLF